MDHPFDDKDGKRRFSVPAMIAMALGGFVLAAALALFFGWIVMLLWNWLMPAIFGLKTITYWQGWGLVLLSHILVKPGFGPGRHGRGHHGPWTHRQSPAWKEHLGRHFGGRRGEASGPESAPPAGG